MHIYFDYQIFALQSFGGISRYFVELAEKLSSRSEVTSTTILAPLHINSHLNICSVNTLGKKVMAIPAKHYVLPLINRFCSRISLKNAKPDIFHETYYTDKPLYPNAPRVLTVYDMIHERYPEYFSGIERVVPYKKANAVHRADHVITISHSTRDDLIAFLDVPEHKISVIPLATSFASGSLQKNDITHDKPYLLYVGLRNRVKNFITLFKAYAQSKQLHTHFDLVCVGGGEFSESELKMIKGLGLEKKVQHINADDKKLISLYVNATLFIYPSLYEGFGLPLLEAMRCHCPIICSKTSSMPEIAGDAAIYFDPQNHDELRQVIEDVANSTETLQLLKKRGYVRQKLYSWEKCAEKTALLYKNLM